MLVNIEEKLRRICCSLKSLSHFPQILPDSGIITGMRKIAVMISITKEIFLLKSFDAL